MVEAIVGRTTPPFVHAMVEEPPYGQSCKGFGEEGLG
jgi:hypothetical protein